MFIGFLAQWLGGLLFSQQHLDPIAIKNFNYYVDSVVINPEFDKKIGFVQNGIRKKILSFGKEKIITVMDGYLRENFSYLTEKNPLLVAINYIDVTILDSANVTVSLSFFEKNGDDIIFLNTIGSSRYNMIAYEKLISLAIKDCFELFTSNEAEGLNYNKKVDDLHYTKTNYPIMGVISNETSVSKGYYKDFISFQNNILTTNETIKTVKHFDQNGEAYYQIFIDDKTNVSSFAVVDGEHVYFRIDRKYYRLNADDNAYFIAHDFHIGVSRDLLVGLGMLGLFPGLAIGDATGGLIGMFVGAGIGAAIYFIVKNRKKKMVVRYNLSLLNGKYELIEIVNKE